MPNPAISLSQLESHLWEAANILRGPVDAADFKTYVFPLLFFKRISDVHDEEYQAALAEAGGHSSPAKRKPPPPRSGRRHGGSRTPVAHKQIFSRQMARLGRSNDFDPFRDIPPGSAQRGSGSLHR